jgi:ketosteroid isomerase-like protein
MRSLSVVLLVLVSAVAARQGEPPRWQLATAFVKRDSVALRRYLAPDVMIWPPPPDTARRGSAAIRYFLNLAAASTVSRSEFRTREVVPDGDYLNEGGFWSFTYDRTTVRARYDMRWRRAEGRWRVIFLRWELFR